MCLNKLDWLQSELHFARILLITPETLNPLVNFRLFGEDIRQLRMTSGAEQFSLAFFLEHLYLFLIS